MSTPLTEPMIEEPAAVPRGAAVWLEVGMVLLVVVVPLVFVSSFARSYRSGPEAGFVFQSVYRVVQAAGTVALIVFVIYRSGRAPDTFGLTRLRVFPDLLGGLGIFVLSMMAYYAFWAVIANLLRGIDLRGKADYSAIASPAAGWHYLVLVGMSLANAAAEELSMRAYLLTRLEQLFQSPGLALLVSAALFAAYHSYQGPMGCISAAILGLIYGVIFIRTRRIWPLIFAHALQDVVAIAALAAAR